MRENSPRFYRLLLLAVTLLCAGTGQAARFAAREPFLLSPNETSVGDIYYAGSILRLAGRLEGSVTAACQSAEISGQVSRNCHLAAQNVSVAGTVDGDVLALCATLNVSGGVQGALRAGCGFVHISGRVGQDLVAGCQSLVVAAPAEIRGDVVAGCSRLEIAGTVRGGVRAAAAEIIISGQIDGDVDLLVGDRLVLTDDARIYGDLRYRAERELNLGNPDAVFGDISFSPRLPAERVPVSRRQVLPEISLPITLYLLAAALAVCLILLAVWQRSLNRAVSTCLSRPGYTIGFGALGLLAMPVAIVIALLLVVTIPAALIAIVGYLVAVYLAKILTGMLTGRLLFRLLRKPDVSLWLAAPAGVVLVYALCSIPAVGWLFWLFSTIVGFGVIIELIAQTRRNPA
ncbi:MAG: polymer-forming cytoskeletal protein [candidate division WOR-3 bacterium]